MMDRIPPDMHLCKVHELANYVRPESNSPYCECCKRSPSSQLYPFSIRLNSISGQVGMGVVNFLRYMSSGKKVMLVLVGMFGVPCTVMNYLGSYCQEGESRQKYGIENVECISDIVMRSSFLNKLDNEQYVTLQGILGGATTLVLLMMVYYREFKIRQKERRQLSVSTRASDYTLMARHLPSEMYSRSDVMNALRVFVAKTGLRSKSLVEGAFEVQLIYDFGDYLGRKKRVKKLSSTLKKVQHQYEHEQRYAEGWDETKVNRLKQEIGRLESENQTIKQLIEEGKYRKNSSMALIQFNSVVGKQVMQRKCQYGYVKRKLGCCLSKVLKVKGKVISLDQASEPSDIIWRNCGFSSWLRFYKECVVFSLTLGLVIGNYFAIYYISQRQQSIYDVAQKSNLRLLSETQYFSVIISLLISVVNSLILLTIKALGNLPRFDTYTDLRIYQIRQMSFALFVNTVALPLIVNINLNTLKFTHSQIAASITGSGGLLYDVFYQSLTQSLYTLLLAIIDPSYIKKLWNRRKFNAIPLPPITQQEANKICEGPQFQIHEQVSQMNMILFMVAFYSPLVPAISFFGLIALFGNYALQKYYILRRYKRPQALSGIIRQCLMQSLKFVILLFAVTSFQNLFTQLGIAFFKIIIFWNDMQDLTQIQIINLLYVLPLALVLIIFILDFLFCPSTLTFKKETLKTYDQIKDQLIEDYHKFNPIYNIT